MVYGGGMWRVGVAVAVMLMACEVGDTPAVDGGLDAEQPLYGEHCVQAAAFPDMTGCHAQNDKGHWIGICVGEPLEGVCRPWCRDCCGAGGTDCTDRGGQAVFTARGACVCVP